MHHRALQCRSECSQRERRGHWGRKTPRSSAAVSRTAPPGSGCQQRATSRHTGPPTMTTALNAVHCTCTAALGAPHRTFAVQDTVHRIFIAVSIVHSSPPTRAGAASTGHRSPTRGTALASTDTRAAAADGGQSSFVSSRDPAHRVDGSPAVDFWNCFTFSG